MRFTRGLGALAASAVLGCAGAPSGPSATSTPSANGSASASPVAETSAASGADTDAGASPDANRDASVDPAPARDALPKASDPPVTPKARLTSVGYTTWIWPEPKASGIFVGYVRVGSSIAIRAGAPVRGEGCKDKFYPVEPRGYVCLDRTATLKPEVEFAEVAAATTGSGGAFPFRYAISAGAPMYNRVPTPAEQKRFERKYGPAGVFKPLIKTLAAHEDLAVTEPIKPTEAIPPFLTEHQRILDSRQGLVRETIPNGSMLSFTRAFEAESRTWLLSSDMTIVPADRVRAFRPSTFRGVWLREGTALPIAWMRASAKPQHALTDGGALKKTAGAWPARSFVRLTGSRVQLDRETYLETTDREPGGGGALYVAESDATVVEARTKLPLGVLPGQKWMHVRITQGTLVAYEGLTPVFATLMSPGSGGVPTKGADPVRMSTTPTGTYYVTFKDRAATMSPDKPGREGERTLWISDVPHTQYFNPPFAVHAAYWHERFGEPTSAGCVNVSPLDAEALFAWSDPPVPAEWQGATGSGAPSNGPTTAIVVSR